MDIFQLAPSIASGDTTFKFDFDAVVKEYIEKNPSKSSGLAAEIGERFAEFLELLVTLKSLVDSGVPINNITSLFLMTISFIPTARFYNLNLVFYFSLPFSSLIYILMTLSSDL